MESVGGVGVLDKAMVIVRSLAGRGPLSLASLQEATELPRATAHRLAVALEAHGLVRRDAAGHFCLGFELIALGRAAADGFPLAELARPALADLRDSTGESVQLYIREGDSRRCVVSLQSAHGLRWIVPEGVLLPLGVGSAGRLLAGGANAAPATEWMESVEEREPGVASVSAAVHDRDGALTAAVSLSGPIERITRRPGQQFGEQVVNTARAVEATLRALA